MTFFAALAANLHGATRQGQFTNEQLGCLLGTRPGVIEEQE
jgi:hypothetical protein